MAVVIGTNAGFVESNPTADPQGSNFTMSNRAWVCHDTSPATAVKITEVGFWVDSGGANESYDVGLYAADGAVVPGEAGTLLEESTGHNVSGASGWQRVTGLNWSIDSSTSYWLAVTLTSVIVTNESYPNDTGTGEDYISDTSFPDPYGGAALLDANETWATYAVWEAAAAEGTNTQINIGDDWKAIAAMQINIGDVWKDVAGAQINIGDAWKEIF